MCRNIRTLFNCAPAPQSVSRANAVRDAKVRTRIAGALLAIAATIASAADVQVEVDGRTEIVKATSLERPIVAEDRDAGSQQSPLNCSFLYFGHLARGDIEAASALSTDPKASAEKLTQYRDRVGAEEFRKTMAAYFTSGNVALAELSLGEIVMLAVKSRDYTAGQFYVRQGGEWRWMERPPLDAAKALGRVLNMIQSGQLKL